MTSGQTYTSGAIALNAGYYLCYVVMNANYSTSGTTTITSSGVSVSGTGVAGGSASDSIQRVIVWGNANTYTMYSGYLSLLIVPASTTVTVSYIPTFTFTSTAIGINGAGSNVTFIRLA